MDTEKHERSVTIEEVKGLAERSQNEINIKNEGGSLSLRPTVYPSNDVTPQL
jgi:hypothetical protein